MPALKFLCLHGAGSNAEILKMQLTPLITRLSRTNTATFHFTDGTVPSAAGPGINAALSPPPYYTFFTWPPVADCPDSTASIAAAYAELDALLADEAADPDVAAPFDGLLGFSHGATLAAGYLADHARRHPAGTPPPVRCAVFFSGIPPFHVEPGDDDGASSLSPSPPNTPGSGSGSSSSSGEEEGEDYTRKTPIVDDALLAHFPPIPTLHVLGAPGRDFAHPHSMALLRAMPKGWAEVLVHGRGHEVPGLADAAALAKVEAAVGELGWRVSLGV